MQFQGDRKSCSPTDLAYPLDGSAVLHASSLISHADTSAVGGRRLFHFALPSASVYTSRNCELGFSGAMARKDAPSLAIPKVMSNQASKAYARPRRPGAGRGRVTTRSRSCLGPSFKFEEGYEHRAADASVWSRTSDFRRGRPWRSSNTNRGSDRSRSP